MKMYILFGLGVMISFTVSAQSFSLTMEPTAFKTPVNNFDTTFAWYCHLLISDTVHLDSIHLKMGTSPGGGQILDHVIPFDKNSGLPSRISYSREGTDIRIGLGPHKRRQYYLEVRLEDDQQVVSAPEVWNN